MRYLLNAPVLTSCGLYRMRPLSLARARLLARGPLVSAVGHAATAQHLGRLLGVEVPEHRQTIRMLPGDDALVFRLLQRPPEGVIHDADALQACAQEFAFLRRLA